MTQRRVEIDEEKNFDRINRIYGIHTPLAEPLSE